MSKKKKSKKINSDKGKKKLLKKKAIVESMQQSHGSVLTVDDIGMVRVEFQLPASRLFGNGGILTAGGGRSGQVAADNNTDDPVHVSDSDTGANQDKAKTISVGPGHYDGVD